MPKKEKPGDKVIISCNVPDWKTALKINLQEGIEVELTNFDYTTDGALCEMLALGHKMPFKLNAKAMTGHFRKPKQRAAI